MAKLIDAEELLQAMKKADEADPDLSTCWSRGSIRRVIEGLLTIEAVVLPCKLGTTLYRVCEEGRGRKPFIRVVAFNRTNFARIVLDNEVGRTVFLTRAEAEAALAKMGGGGGNG